MKKKNFLKRAAAIICILFLVGLYLCTLICSFIQTGFARALLRFSVAATVIVPVLLFIFLKAIERMKNSQS